jgi:hypothetical protein
MQTGVAMHQRGVGGWFGVWSDGPNSSCGPSVATASVLMAC